MRYVIIHPPSLKGRRFKTPAGDRLFWRFRCYSAGFPVDNKTVSYMKHPLLYLFSFQIYDLLIFIWWAGTA